MSKIVRQMINENPIRFDPLKAGWIPCPLCLGRKGYSADGDPRWEVPCPECDALGIIVGPPTDGLRLLTIPVTHPDWSRAVQRVAAANRTS